MDLIVDRHRFSLNLNDNEMALKTKKRDKQRSSYHNYTMQNLMVMVEVVIDNHKVHDCVYLTKTREPVVC